MTNEQETQTAPTADPVATQEIAMLQKAADAGTFKLPDNFKSVEEFYKSYRAMQAQATKVSQENAQLLGRYAQRPRQGGCGCRHPDGSSGRPQASG
jgi:hypothetical protein